MLWQLSQRFYHLLWHTLPKEKIVIEGIDIEYVSLPKIVLKESKTIVHHSSKTQMIFISSDEDALRLTLYHEYMESCAMLSIGLFAENETVRTVIQSACDEVREEIPGIESLLVEYVRKTDDHPHAYALVLELALAKRELSPSNYADHWQYAVEHRI